MASSGPKNKAPTVFVNLKDSAQHLFETSKYSDLTIKSGQKEWKVHKTIVCPRSAFFAKACDGKFKEADEKIINLEEDKSQAVEALLRHFYGFHYDDTAAMPDIAPILFGVDMHIIADKYGVEDLQEFAADEFHDRVEEEWNTENFARAVEFVYNNAPDPNHDLRDFIIAVVCDHGWELYKDEVGKAFRKVAEALPSFSWDLFGEMMLRSRR